MLRIPLPQDWRFSVVWRERADDDVSFRLVETTVELNPDGDADTRTNSLYLYIEMQMGYSSEVSCSWEPVSLFSGLNFDDGGYIVILALAAVAVVMLSACIACCKCCYTMAKEERHMYVEEESEEEAPVASVPVQPMVQTNGSNGRTLGTAQPMVQPPVVQSLPNTPTVMPTMPGQTTPADTESGTGSGQYMSEAQFKLYMQQQDMMYSAHMQRMQGVTPGGKQ
ncbi:hypothetical protein KIPB_010343 [Kipferlia bialata]|uniref:Uncharacterized protein n=1 Tax=Kipferlia bialata TaxID=797122 RepID=A0A9K3D2X6_9EUKA|nr:hypothetical protein KIPB_010343 [Kipferlia bialata]|eukprot:g10343.t1